MSFRSRSRTVAFALALVGLTAPAFASAAQASVSDKPGKVGSPVVLADHDSYPGGFDLATDGAGNTYIAWIGDLTSAEASRTVFLCTLPPGSSTCRGGAQHIDALSVSTAAGLRVLVSKGGLVTLVWWHEVNTEAYLGRDGRIAMATSQSGGPLTAATDVADTVSNGELLDAELGPDGAVWTVTGYGAGTDSIQVREGVANPEVPLTMPFSPGYAKLAFSGSTPVIGVDSYGSITVPIIYAHGVGGGFSAWKSMPKTWSGANLGLVGTKSGVRLITTIDDASYWPVVAKWTGSGFSARKPTGEKNACAPSSHDVGTDSSGRVVDVNNECGSLAVSDLPNTTSAGIVRFSAGGYVSSGNPQIASTSRGHAVVVWAIEDGGGTGNRLMFVRVNLPGFDTAVGKKSAGGTAVVTGPASCLPASSIAVAVHGSPAKGWKVSGASLKLGNTKIASKSTLHGATLTPNKLYTLTGTVTFSKASRSTVAKAVLKFRACANP